MIIREAIQQFKGFRYIVEQLDICSSLGRRVLYEMPWLNSMEEIGREFNRIGEVCSILQKQNGSGNPENVACKLMQVRDIRGTVGRMGTTCILDDLELFELKSFALLADEIKDLVSDWKWVILPDLKPVITILDPEGSRIPHFYIYDVYSPELTSLRKEIKQKIQIGAGDEEVEKLRDKTVELEDGVRKELSEKVRHYYPEIRKALEIVALIDISLAKAKQVEQLQLNCPELVNAGGTTVYKGLFNPQLKDALRGEGKDFQPVDIELWSGATVITGANMAGKTVLLKSVALAQVMCQFGFYVPASKAVIQLIDKVLLSIGDEQDELSGLSSFAAEMLCINEIAERIRSGQKVLVLIDELARTTNPVEGRAIVNGVVEFLSENQTQALVTTHYSGIVAKCRRLRVKGFVENRIQGNVTLKNINEFIDYSLEEDDSETAPHEAMRIAWMLGVDSGLLQKAEYFLAEKA